MVRRSVAYFCFRNGLVNRRPLFPLTLTLSLGERESGASDCEISRGSPAFFAFLG